MLKRVKDLMQEAKRIFATTNRTSHDVEKAIANGSFAVEASDYERNKRSPPARGICAAETRCEARPPGMGARR